VGEVRGREIVISFDDCAAMFPDQGDAFIRICAVADDIAKAENIIHLRPVNDCQGRFECLEVCVDIREDRDASRRCTFGVRVLPIYRNLILICSR
jgi:hypothetical protein